VIPELFAKVLEANLSVDVNMDVSRECMSAMKPVGPGWILCARQIFFSVATCSLTLTERILALIDTEIRNKAQKKISSEVTLVVFSTLIK
jgi:hypothetical protein